MCICSKCTIRCNYTLRKWEKEKKKAKLDNLENLEPISTETFTPSCWAGRTDVDGCDSRCTDMHWHENVLAKKKIHLQRYSGDCDLIVSLSACENLGMIWTSLILPRKKKISLCTCGVSNITQSQDCRNHVTF